MEEKVCDFCKHGGERGFIERYHIIPKEIREQAGIRRSKIVKLCPECKRELERWYATRVSNTGYDNGSKQFRARPGVDLAREYKNAFTTFERYQKGRKQEG